jgi:hypothetical protein
MLDQAGSTISCSAKHHGAAVTEYDSLKNIDARETKEE